MAGCNLPTAPPIAPPTTPPTAPPTEPDHRDAVPKLAIEGASAAETDGTLRFPVALSAASGDPVTVSYATEDHTATADVDYMPANGTLSFAAGTTGQTIGVTMVTDDVTEGAETLLVTLSNPIGAEIAVATATGTITDGAIADPPQEPAPRNLPLEIASLQVTGGGAMYPTFSPGTLHYAVRCTTSTQLRVTAQARRSGAHLTLRRNDPSRNHRSTGSLQTQVTADDDHDIAIELSDGGRAVTYVVHCIPPRFPDVNILTKTRGVADGLIFLAPRYQSVSDGEVRYMAIVDNNGVPRFHAEQPLLNAGFDFKRTRHTAVVDGNRARYLLSTTLYDEHFSLIGTADTSRDLIRHELDFLITEDGNFLFLAYLSSTRDFSSFTNSRGEPYSDAQPTRDTVIQERTPAGQEVFRWNSWDHRDTLNVGHDCKALFFPDYYAYPNALQMFEGDIVVSLRGCSQVLRIDRETGDVVWKLGGTAPEASAGAEHLEVVGDSDADNEFCAQHQPTATSRGTVVLFDNGVRCLGPRKNRSPFTRVVEYDIASGTQAELVRQYLLPEEQGYTFLMGAVDVLPNGHWLISWGDKVGPQVPPGERVTVSEVDPDTGTVVLAMNLSKSGAEAITYRAHREPEAAVEIPLNLP